MMWLALTLALVLRVTPSAAQSVPAPPQLPGVDPVVDPAPDRAPASGWIGRHPILAGALIGTGVGAGLSRTEWAGGVNHDPKVALLGTGYGALGGALVSMARRRHLRFESLTTSQPAAARLAVIKIGRGQSILAVGRDGTRTVGRVVAIEADHYLVIPDGRSQPVELAFEDVRSVRPKPLGRGAKIGLAAATVAAILVPRLAYCAAGGCAER